MHCVKPFCKHSASLAAAAWQAVFALRFLRTCRDHRVLFAVALSPPGRSPVSAAQAGFLSQPSKAAASASVPAQATLTRRGFSGQGRSLPQGQGCSESLKRGWNGRMPGLEPAVLQALLSATHSEQPGKKGRCEPLLLF